MRVEDVLRSGRMSEMLDPHRQTSRNWCMVGINHSLAGPEGRVPLTAETCANGCSGRQMRKKRASYRMTFSPVYCVPVGQMSCSCQETEVRMKETLPPSGMRPPAAQIRYGVLFLVTKLTKYLYCSDVSLIYSIIQRVRDVLRNQWRYNR